VAAQRLTPTAKVILGMLRLGARTGYEIKTITDVSTRFFWGASYGQIYPELKRLETAGLVRSEHDPRGGVKRTAYTLTAAGAELLQEWLTSDDLPEFAFRDEGLLRFFFGDVVDEEAALENVRRQRLEYEQRLAHFRTIQPGEEMRYPRLALEYGIAFLEWNVRWWGDLERRLSRPGARPSRLPETKARARR
jgi:PadR family transcriptional regulator, regulatory protein AphA